jgi:hypothetical protein
MNRDSPASSDESFWSLPTKGALGIAGAVGPVNLDASTDLVDIPEQRRQQVTDDMQPCIWASEPHDAAIATKESHVMITHVSAFNWAVDMPQADADQLLDGVRGIAADVRGIGEIRCGRNTSPLTQGLEYAIYVSAEDQAALDRYRAHPAHHAAAQAMDRSQVRDADHMPGLVIDIES